MNGARRVAALLRGEPADRVGFWPGNPTPEAASLYCSHLDLDPEAPGAALELATALGSDLLWCSPELDPRGYRHPAGRPMWDPGGGRPRRALDAPGVLAGCASPAELESYPWPDPRYVDFSATLATIERAEARGMAVLGGMWMPFFHILCDLFGMEDYFIAMHTRPAVIAAATERVLDFYLEANRRCLDAMAPRLSALFFGNDLGSQQGLLISPADLELFILPGVRRIVEQAHSYGLPVVLHSCGAVAELIPALLGAGIAALHPLQARAHGMEAEALARYRGELLFIGAVDTQHILPFESPQRVRAEVERLIAILGPRFIVSPSHEALLPNVSPENLLAMRAGAFGEKGE